MEKTYYKLKATVQLIGDLIHIERSDKFDLFKKVLTLETPDRQVLYPELWNNKLKILERQNITVGCAVEIEYCFHGSEKNGKIYNNIFIHRINKL